MTRCRHITARRFSDKIERAHCSSTRFK